MTVRKWVVNDYTQNYPFKSINAVCDILTEGKILFEQRAEYWEFDDETPIKVLAYRYLRDEDEE